ncbi:MAG: hypothetical protein DMD81_25810 [Candidatus Rokuibacteriota bacterium]|nr:MAG: hypothetical protein DMD81_25810 [Candidatus Rokubacteria bacterium]
MRAVGQAQPFDGCVPTTFFARAALVVGQILWYQVEPSLMWLPFRRIRSLHLGHVPIQGLLPRSVTSYYSKLMPHGLRRGLRESP